jgi:hypothetical protein
MRASLGLASLSPTARAWALDILAGLLLVLILMALWVAGACEAQVLTAVQNVSFPCITTNPCTCPILDPAFVPVQENGVWSCRPTQYPPPPPLFPIPVPTLSEWALIALGLMLSLVGVRRLR